MSEARTFADAIGRKKMAAALQVGETAVSNAVVRGKFPSSWNETCRLLAAEARIEFPVELFGQRGAYSTRRVDAPHQVQPPDVQKEYGGGAA